MPFSNDSSINDSDVALSDSEDDLFMAAKEGLKQK